jgi:hypothetical protein
MLHHALRVWRLSILCMEAQYLCMKAQYLGFGCGDPLNLKQ